MQTAHTRILMFGWEFPPYNSGGLGVACKGLTHALHARGLEIIFVMPRRLNLSSPDARFVFAEGDIPGRTYIIDSPLTPYVTEHSYMNEPGRAVYAGNLFDEVIRYRALGAEIASREDFDVIYAHDWLTFGAGIEAKRATGKPLIVHVHATEYDRCGGTIGMNDMVYAIEREGMLAADRVIAVSGYTKDIIVRHYGIPPEKVCVVYNGIDESTAPLGAGISRMRTLKRSGYKIVLFLGRITLQKGPDYFLRAAKRVLGFNKKILFVISGSGDMAGAVMRLAADLGISANVHFTGFLSGADRHEMYTAADLFVMPSVSEPFGIAPLEAMKLGTPALISKQSGVAEVVHHALKADFWDVEEMANMMLSVVGYPGLKETLADHARHEADRLTWDDAAKKVEHVVEELAHTGVQ